MTTSTAHAASFTSAFTSGGSSAYHVACPDCLATTLLAFTGIQGVQDFRCACGRCPAVWVMRVTPATVTTPEEIAYHAAACHGCQGQDTARPAAPPWSGLPPVTPLRWQCGVCGHVGGFVPTTITPVGGAAGSASGFTGAGALHPIQSPPQQPAQQPVVSVATSPGGWGGQPHGYSWGQSNPNSQMASAQSSQSPQSAQPASPAVAQPPSADDLRDQAREAAFGLAAGIGDALRELRADDYATALPAAWEDMQRAFDTLYTTLGGRRNLGDYPPDPFNTRRDVTQVAMRLILLLRAVERMTW